MIPFSTRTRTLTLALLAIGGGCDRAPAASARTVADSAGVEIVTVAMTDPPPHRGWRIDSAAAVRIGVSAGDASLELAEVAGAVRLADDRIAIANGGTSELRYYEAGGAHIQSVGGDGEGPGEFRALSFIARDRADTVLTYDSRLRRLSRFAGSGEFAGSRTITGILLPYIAGVLASGAVVAWEFTGADDDRVGIYTAPVVFGLIDATSGEFQPVDTIPSGEAARVRYQGRVTRAFRPFARETDLAAAQARFFVLASTDDRAIRVYDETGVLERIVRVEAPTQAADGPSVEAWVESWIRSYGTGSAQLEAAWRHGFRETPAPELIPLFRSVEADTEGNVCAERYPLTVDAAPVYWCFTPDGHFLGMLALPAGLFRQGPPHFDPQLEIGTDHVLGVWSDSLDVQQVRQYPLRRSDGVD